METLLAVSGQPKLAPIGSAPEAPQPVPHVPEVEENGDSIQSLRDALQTAQARIVYFERFGPWVEEQMAAVVERATSLESESERRRAETSEEIAALHAEVANEIAAQRAEVANELAAARSEADRKRKEINAELIHRRHELEELKAECDSKREEARVTIAAAHTTADLVMTTLSESAGGIVQRTLADFETLRSKLTPEALAASAVTEPVSDEPAAETGEMVADNCDDEPRRGWLRFGK